MQIKNSLSEVDSMVLSPSSVAYALHDNVYSLLFLCLVSLFRYYNDIFILLMFCLRISYMNMLYFNQIYSIPSSSLCTLPTTTLPCQLHVLSLKLHVLLVLPVCAWLQFIHWNMGSLSGVHLRKINSSNSSSISHQFPEAPQIV